jgi:hypothetical protein
MSTKRRWDQPGDEAAAAPASSTTKPEDSASKDKSASEAAAAAAAIAAKIAAQFASGGFDSFGKDSEPEFTHDIDINDVRNRYLLTKGSTQDQASSVDFVITLQGLKPFPSRFMKILVQL